eukprot:scaffold7329_cov222-Pinguiococcus_pyrenoidosus.AAC.5
MSSLEASTSLARCAKVGAQRCHTLSAAPKKLEAALAQRAALGSMNTDSRRRRRSLRRDSSILRHKADETRIRPSTKRLPSGPRFHSWPGPAARPAGLGQYLALRRLATEDRKAAAALIGNRRR